MASSPPHLSIVVRVAIGCGAALGIALDVASLAAGFPVGLWLVPAALVGLGLGLRSPALGLLEVCALGVVASVAARMLGYPSPPGFTEAGAIAVLAFGTVRRERVALVAAGAAALLSELGLLVVRGFDTDLGPVGLVVLVIVIAGATAAADYLRWLDRLAVRAGAAARQQERLSLARELHDTVAHHVTGIVVQAQGALAVGRDRPDVALRALEAIEASGGETMHAMRRLVGTLREGEVPLAPAAGAQQLRELVAEAERTGPPVRLLLDDTELPDDLAPTVYRVVQEALTNVRRHAPTATVVEVRVTRWERGLEVCVCNDGGADPASGPEGFGLVGLRERARALGGVLRAGPGDGGGWEVRVWLPTGR